MADSLFSPPPTKSRQRRLRAGAQQVAKASYVSFAAFLGLAVVGALVQVAKHFGGEQAEQLISSAVKPPPSSSKDDSLWKLTWEATVTAARLWGRLLLAVVIPTSEQSFVYAREGWSAFEPSLKQSLVWLVYESSPALKASLAGLAGLLAALWFAEREIRRRRWVEKASVRIGAVKARYDAATRAAGDRLRAVQADVARTSKLLALLLPHLIVLASGALLMLVAPDVTAYCSRGFAAWGVMAGVPLVASTRLLLPSAGDAGAPPPSSSASSDSGLEGDADDDFRPDMLTSAALAVRKRFISDADDVTVRPWMPSSTEQAASATFWLKYWSVVATLSLVEQAPGLGHVLGLVPVWPEMRLVLGVWLQLPLTSGADVAFQWMVPLMDKYFRRMPAVSGERQGMALQLLAGTGLVSESTRAHLAEVMSTGGPVLVLSLPFFISPSVVTRLGVLLVSLAFPAHASAAAVMRGEPSPAWLEYWIVFALFSPVYAALEGVFGWWLPLWDQMHLVALLWLQLPYFWGARRVFAVVVLAHRAWRRRLQRKYETDMASVPEGIEPDESPRRGPVPRPPPIEALPPSTPSTAPPSRRATASSSIVSASAAARPPSSSSRRRSSAASAASAASRPPASDANAEQEDEDDDMVLVEAHVHAEDSLEHIASDLADKERSDDDHDHDDGGGGDGEAGAGI